MKEVVNVNLEIDIKKIVLAIPPEDEALFLCKLFAYFNPRNVIDAYRAFESLQAFRARKSFSKSRQTLKSVITHYRIPPIPPFFFGLCSIRFNFAQMRSTKNRA